MMEAAVQGDSHVMTSAVRTRWLSEAHRCELKNAAEKQQESYYQQQHNDHDIRNQRMRGCDDLDEYTS